jgi:hypothetical protein
MPLALTSPVPAVLFDQFVGCGQQRFRDGKAERLGGLEVDDEWAPAQEGRQASNP